MIKFNRASKFLWVVLVLTASAGEAAAAVCTTKANTNTWNQAAAWTCGHVPGAADTVVISRNITLDTNRSIAGLTINAGATLIDNGNDLTSTGNVVINGTYNGSGNNGSLIMTGNGSTLSGTGTVIDIKRIQVDANVTIPAGSNLNLTLQSEIRVGKNSPATLTIDGTITGTGQTNGNRLIRVDDNNTSTVIINGSINAPNAFIEIQQNGTVQNNGSVTIAYLDGNGDAGVTWTQGANSTLALSQQTQGWNSGTFNASATGNTVTFNGAAKPFNPATYYNIAGTGVTCPHPAGITVLGSTPCVTFPTVTSINTAGANPTAPATAVAWTVTFSASVTGVDATDFALVPSGGVSGASITGVTGSGTTWVVNANTGSGTGTLGLNLVDNDSIVDAGARKLGGTGAGNGNFTGQVYTVSMPMTCITDNFSAGLDANLWKVLTIKGTFTPQVVNLGGGDSRLRLTDTGGNEATFAQLKRTFPGAGNKIVLEIDYFAYGGSGADGIAVTFSDSAISSTTGGFGGSLGYARNGVNDGFGGGWLGIGLDEYGNFPNPTEGRLGYPAGWIAPAPANVAAGFYKTNVSIRGSGSGQTGYNLLANTGVLATPVAPAVGAAGATPYRYRFTIDHSNGVNAWVTVERDTTATGTAYQTLVPTFDVKAANSGQVAVPPSWLISFTGSTGGATNFHEFKQVRVCANTILGGGPHHFEIQHVSGTGVTCTPSTLTVKACADGAVPCTPYTSGATGTLSATGTPTLNWIGGAGFSIPAGSSTITKEVQVTQVGTVVFDATSTPATTAATSCNFGAPACTFTATDSALLLTTVNHVAETPASLTVKAVKAAPGNPLVCTPGMTGNKTVNLKCAYTNPATGTLPVRVAGSALNAANNATAACDATGQTLTLNFDATGTTTTTLQYADVGRMSLSATHVGAGTSAGLVLTGNTSFITAPASIGITGVSAGPVKASTPFAATVSVLNAAGNPVPNFGKETAPEGVALSSVLAMGAGTWNNPALNNGVIPGGSFSNGVATLNNLGWGEVGAITLHAQLTSGNYLASGVASAIGNTATATTFVPNHFGTEILSGALLGCPTGLTCPVNVSGASGMAYSGQPFGVTVYALNGNTCTPAFDIACITQNYRGAYAQDVTLSAVGSGTLNNPALTAVNFTSGVATTPTLPNIAIASNSPPADIAIRATGGSSSSSGFVEAGLKVANGRIRVGNAYGSDKVPLTVPVMIQYFDGTQWVLSSTDGSTLLSGLSAPGATVVNPGTLSGGVLQNFKLRGTGNVTVGYGLPAYLDKVDGQVTFGIYKGNNEFIYRREAY